jgi:hypothetical protein
VGRLRIRGLSRLAPSHLPSVTASWSRSEPDRKQDLEGLACAHGNWSPSGEEGCKEGCDKEGRAREGCSEEDGSREEVGRRGSENARDAVVSRCFVRRGAVLSKSDPRPWGGQPIRRLTLFEALNRSPDSGPTRQLITSSNQYGITTGGYTAETLALTQLGDAASSPTAAKPAQFEARARLAILDVGPFSAIYDQYAGSRLPSIEVLRDAAGAAGVPAEQRAECVETFLANARELGLIRNIGGSEHLISIEAMREELERSSDRYEPPEPAGVSVSETLPVDTGGAVSRAPAEVVSTTVPLTNTCFVVSPIGEPESVERRHADLMLTAFIEPALAELGLTAVRADKISVPGLITGQVMDHVARAKLVIADLSFGNPNVYYELALRHATRKPIVQIIRTADRLPFDVGQFRTVTIDMTDIYTLVPQIDLHRQEITRQCRAAIADGATAESPLSRFYPQFWNQIAEPK